MARRKTLISLLTDLRVEARLSLNPAHNVQVRDSHVRALQTMQEWLWEEFSWPHLRVERFLDLQAGQQYYDLPDDLDLERVEKIEVRYNGRWIEVHYGITATDYTQYDSYIGVRAWPVLRWRITEDEQIEMHPIPDQNADTGTLEGRLRVTGIKKLSPLVADDDRSDLDARLIVLHVAAQMLAATGAKDAALKQAQANKLFARLRGNLTPRRKFRMFGAGSEPHSHLRGPPPVYYRVVTDTTPAGPIDEN